MFKKGDKVYVAGTVVVTIANICLVDIGTDKPFGVWILASDLVPVPEPQAKQRPKPPKDAEWKEAPEDEALKQLLDAQVRQKEGLAGQCLD